MRSVTIMFPYELSENQVFVSNKLQNKDATWIKLKK